MNICHANLNTNINFGGVVRTIFDILLYFKPENLISLHYQKTKKVLPYDYDNIKLQIVVKLRGKGGNINSAQLATNYRG